MGKGNSSDGQVISSTGNIGYLSRIRWIMELIYSVGMPILLATRKTALSFEAKGNSILMASST
jgi:hypothetical protein